MKFSIVFRSSQRPPTEKLRCFFICNIVFEFAELFLVAILVRNHKKIALLTEKNSCDVNSK